MASSAFIHPFPAAAAASTAVSTDAAYCSHSSLTVVTGFPTVCHFQKLSNRASRGSLVPSASAALPRTDAVPGNGGLELRCDRSALSMSRRQGLVIATAGLAALAPALPALAAILEADDDIELLERVKKDRQKRIERQGVINSSNKERGYLQDVVYKLSKVGQAIDNNDLSAASSVLGSSTKTEWVQNVNAAFNKLTSSTEGMTEIDSFNSSLESLISSVGKKDVESSKLALVSSASAFEKWIALAGLAGELKGL